jgi:hypothetical protein
MHIDFASFFQAFLIFLGSYFGSKHGSIDGK